MPQPNYQLGQQHSGLHHEAGGGGDGGSGSGGGGGGMEEWTAGVMSPSPAPMMPPLPYRKPSSFKRSSGHQEKKEFREDLLGMDDFVDLSSASSGARGATANAKSSSALLSSLSSSSSSAAVMTKNVALLELDNRPDSGLGGGNSGRGSSQGGRGLAPQVRRGKVVP